MRKIPLILSLSILYLFLACKTDNSNEEASPMEQAYLEDYQPSPFKWGFIDLEGRELIAAIYDDCRDFSEGLAAVNKGGYWGYIDINGKEVISPQYRSAFDFNDGYSIALNFSNEHLILDKNGGIVMRLEGDELRYIGNYRFALTRNRYQYLIDPKRTATYDMPFDQISPFEGQHCIVRIDNQYFLMDTSGYKVNGTKYDEVNHIGYGIYTLIKNDTQYLYYADQIEELNENPHNIFAVAPNEIITTMTSGQHHWTSLLTKETKSIPLEEIDDGGEGFLHYFKNGKVGVADKFGSIITPSEYDVLYRFQEGRCIYSINDAWGYLTESGEAIIPPIFPLAWDFKNGRARIISSGGIGFIDKSGTVVIQPRFVEVKDFHQNLARFQKYRQS